MNRGIVRIHINENERRLLEEVFNNNSFQARCANFAQRGLLAIKEKNDIQQDISVEASEEEVETLIDWIKVEETGLRSQLLIERNKMRLQK